MRISQLTEMQRSHMAWRLDAKTACGMLTACRIARLELGDLDVTDVFVRYGGRSPHSAKCHAAKVAKFMMPDKDLTMTQPQPREWDRIPPAYHPLEPSETVRAQDVRRVEEDRFVEAVPGDNRIGSPVGKARLWYRAPSSALTEAQRQHLGASFPESRPQMERYLLAGAAVGITPQKETGPDIPPFALYVVADPEFWIDCAVSVDAARAKAAELGLPVTAVTE